MPLSEHEERILAEIERQLAAEDPRFVARARRSPRSLGRTTRLRLAIALAVIGAICAAGLVFSIVFGAIGISLIFVAILLGASAVRQRGEAPQQASVPPDDLT
jgi:protein-S-isoprenylcysteine O-methyltransferase Ste14